MLHQPLQSSSAAGRLPFLQRANPTPRRRGQLRAPLRPHLLPAHRFRHPRSSARTVACYQGRVAGRARHIRLAGDTNPASEIIPKGDAQLGTGLCQAEESVAAVAPDIAARAVADLSLRHLAADVVLRAVGVQRDVRMIAPARPYPLLQSAGVAPAAHDFAPCMGL